jgi:S-adenosylmethionine decarboxylase
MALGKHFILECRGCDSEALKNASLLETVLKESAINARAEILYSYFHKFDQGEGITGIIALAESHISIHTWPEHDYMAIDIFMCGECNPQDSIDYIEKNIKIGVLTVQILERGVGFYSEYS